MVRLANDLNFAMDLKVSDAILIRKTIAAEHMLATVEKALEAAGGAGFYRKTGLERFLRDAHAAQFHPLSAKKQHRFTGRLALGLDPIAEAADLLVRPTDQKIPDAVYDYARIPH
jgi:alkylation response protein AidB-like acyl-CoA dehydrogenase